MIGRSTWRPTHGVHLVERNVRLGRIFRLALGRRVGKEQLRKVDAAFPDVVVGTKVVDVSPGLEAPVCPGSRGQSSDRKIVLDIADVVHNRRHRVGEGNSSIDPGVAWVGPVVNHDHSWLCQLEINVDNSVVRCEEVGNGSAAHEAQRGYVGVLGTGYHASADVKGQRRGRSVRVEADRLGIKPEVVLALHAADAVMGIFVEQVKRT